MTAAVLERPTVVETETGDPDILAHLADKDEITHALVFGNEITALCGYRWVPSRDPEKYPLCKACQEVYDLILEIKAKAV